MSSNVESARIDGVQGQSALEGDSLTASHSKARRIGRFVAALVAMSIGLGLGIIIAVMTYYLLRNSFSEVGALWGSVLAALGAVWKAIVDAVKSMFEAWRYATGETDSFDHINSMFSIGTTGFGLMMGLLTFVSPPDLGFEPPPPPPSPPELSVVRVPEISVAYVASYDGYVAPTLMMAPTLVYESASLVQRNLPDLSATPGAITRSMFNSKAVDLDEQQKAAVATLLKKLATECAIPGTKDALVLTVHGFANDWPISGIDGKPRADSDLLNLAVANFRGEALANSLRQTVAETLPQHSPLIHIYWQPWNTFGAMRAHRDKKVFRNMHISLSPRIDHRSAVIEVTQSGGCPGLIPPVKGPKT